MTRPRRRPRARAFAAALAVVACACATPLRVGTSLDYQPFSYEAGGRPQGFDISLTRRFAGARGTRYLRFAWPELLDRLAGEEFDLAASGITVRPERSVAGRFTIAVARSGALVIRRIAPPADPDARGVRIAVNRGGHLERVARARFPRARIEAVSPNAAVLARLLDGRADAVVTDTLEAPHWLRRAGPGYEALPPFTRDRKAWLLPPGSEALARRIDTWLLARERDGSLAALRREAFGADTAATATPAAALVAAIDERLSLMPAVAADKQRRAAPIEDRAQERRVVAAALAAVEREARAAGRASPPAAATRTFYCALIEAAKDVQRALAATRTDVGTDWDLQRDLRPALARISERIARLVVAYADSPGAVDARDFAPLPGLRPARARQIAAAIRALGAPRATSQGSPLQPPDSATSNTTTGMRRSVCAW